MILQSYSLLCNRGRIGNVLQEFIDTYNSLKVLQACKFEAKANT